MAISIDSSGIQYFSAIIIYFPFIYLFIDSFVNLNTNKSTKMNKTGKI